jgi:thioredoxin 1
MSVDEEVERINRKKMEEMLQMRKRSQTGQTNESDGMPIVLTDASFSSEVSRHPLMVVDFWAPWCGPCRMVGPVIEQLASEYAGRVTFGKLNVDDNPITSNAFGIQSIPTLLVFRNGQPVDGLMGAAPKSQIESKFGRYLSDSSVRSSVYT